MPKLHIKVYEDANGMESDWITTESVLEMLIERFTNEMQENGKGYPPCSSVSGCDSHGSYEGEIIDF